MAPEARYDYGRSGRIGIATPQANPTVEAEFSILFPRAVLMQVSRLVSADPDVSQRLVDYITNLEDTLKSYGSMTLSAVGFACTGSSYLIGAAREDEIVKRLSAKLGYPVVTAAAAIKAVLQARGISKIALVAPYPQPLIDRAVEYWSDAGLEIVSSTRVPTRTDNTETIYELSSKDAENCLRELEVGTAQAVLLSGTGMPTLACIAQQDRGIPVFSSNLCLAWQLLSITGLTEYVSGPAPEIAGWRERLGEQGL